MNTRRLIGLCCLLVFGWAPKASAHELDLALLSIHQLSDADYAVLWKTTNTSQNTPVATPTFPKHCSLTTAPLVESSSTHTIQRLNLRCPKFGLANQRILFPSGEHVVGSIMVKTTWKDTPAMAHVLSPPPAQFQLPDKNASTVQSSTHYFRLGFTHLLGGFDHLLFLLGLMILLSSAWDLIRVITSFTVGHCITLLIASIGLVSLDSPPIEACIALSIAILGVEIANGQRGRAQLISRYPALLAGLFGLLHGLGFSGALNEIGLPTQNTVGAIFFFNVGVEAAQLMVIGLVFFPIRWAQKNQPKVLSQAVAWSLGVLGFYWVFDRVLLGW